MAPEHDHPHVRGEDEWFRMLFSYRVNVDAAKRAVASGDVVPRRVTYPVKVVGQRMFGMTDAQFGSRDYAEPASVSLMDGPPVEYGRLASLPDDKFSEPLLWAMFDQAEAEAVVRGRRSGEPGRAMPVLVDGNHRLVKRYLDGDEGSVPCDFLSMADLKPVCYPAGGDRSLAEIEAGRARRRPRPPREPDEAEGASPSP